MSQGADPSYTSSPSEEETQGNAEDPILRRSVRDIKPPSPWAIFEGKQYGAQLFSINMEDKMNTTKNLNSIALNTIFDQVLNVEPAQEAPGAHEQISFKKGYKIFSEREIAVMFKE